MADQPSRDPAGRHPPSQVDHPPSPGALLRRSEAPASLALRSGLTPVELHTAVVLIGHGAPATDCPPDLVGELMGLEWRTARPRHADDSAPRLEARAAELDAKIREWPRHPGNDPYKAGLERLADALRPRLPTGLFAIGYNEFCRPSISEAVETVIARGARRVLVIPTMLTPGGVHSERDIPQALEGVRQAHPAIRIDYLWPFNLEDVAALLAAHVTRALHAERGHAIPPRPPAP